MTNAFTWRAYYTDGSVLNEYEDGVHHGFAAVDLDRVNGFALVPTDTSLRPYLVTIDRASGMRPIFFRRHFFNVNVVTGERYGDDVAHCIGWQKTVEGRNVANYTFILSDGSVIVTDDHNAI